MGGPDRPPEPSGLAGPSDGRKQVGAHPARAFERLLLPPPRNGAVVATYDGAHRNPALLHRSLWTAVAEQVTGDAGARAFLRAHPALVTTVECADIGDPRDIDSPADLAAWADRLSGRGCPDVPRRPS